MAMKITRAVKLAWLNENPGAAADECGYWRSMEGRFKISPNYRHTIYPDSYTVTDRINKVACSYDRVRDCKTWAVMRVEDDLRKDGLAK